MPPAYSFKLHAISYKLDDPMDATAETRRRSAYLFGNEKAVEVILALDAEGTATAQMVAAKTGLAYSLARDALKRLSAGGAIREMPKLGGSRSSLYYEPVKDDLWRALTTAARTLATAAREGANAGTEQPTPRD